MTVDHAKIGAAKSRPPAGAGQDRSSGGDVAMQRFDYRPMRVVVVASLASVAAACSTDSFSNVNLIPRADFARADWLSFSGNKEEFTLRTVGPEDLVGPQGQ